MKQYSLLALIIASTLVGCGGGSGSTSNSTVGNSLSSAPSVKTSDVAQGMISGFGSVIVNGVHYDVKDARIDEDGDSRVESELNVGQMVKITGAINADGLAGKATKLSAATQVRGPISSIDLTTGVIVVLGQTLLITGDTFYENDLTPANLKVGDIIKVSGFANADGNFTATRIEVKTGTEAKNLLLSGAVADLNTTAMTFTLNGITVDYSKATIADLPNKTIANGLLVRVHGSVVNNIFVAAGNVHLSELDLKHDDNLDTKANVEMGGLVTQLDIPLGESLIGPSFMLGTTKVLFTTSINIKGGSLSDLANDVRVRVKGTLNADKNLVAEKIILILGTKVDDEGLVQATDLTKNTLTLNGVTFETTTDTSFNDRSKAKVRLFSLKDLVTGDFIEVRGYKLAATSSTPERIIATRIERKNPSEKDKDGFKTEIKGVIESVVNDTIKVSGHTIKVTSTTQLKGFNSVEVFLSGAVGLDVEIKGVIENDVFIARVIEVEDDEHESHSSSSKSSTSNSSSSTSSSSKSSSSLTSASSTSSAVSSVSSASSAVSSLSSAAAL